MFENVDGRTDGWTDRRTDGRRTDDGVTGILLVHPRAFGSDELKKLVFKTNYHLMQVKSIAECSFCNTLTFIKLPFVI